MAKYKVTAGQNLFDIALHIYGSIEGIVDLMINNPDLSLCDTLKTGDELIYTDGFVINADVVVYNKHHCIIPANGERNVYYKTSPLPTIAEIIIKNTQTTASFVISGNGMIDIDWGDNTLIQPLTLSNEKQAIYHSFDNQIPKARRIRVYGNIKNIVITYVDFSNLNPSEIYILQPITTESFALSDCSINIGFASLLRGTYEIDFTNIKTESLLPLLELKQLMTLHLSGKTITQKITDEYLIGLVKQYYERRNCIITLPIHPSGEYKEPKKDANSNYILTNGMEAVWVLTNEPAWNEGGYWKIITNDKIYTSEHE